MIARVVSDRLIRTCSIAAILAGLVVRLGLLASAIQDSSRAVTPDSQEYLSLAENLWRAGIFSSAHEPPLVPDHQRTPGLPALWWALHAMGLHGDVSRLMLQALLGLAVCGAGAFVALRLGGSRLAWTAGAALCLDPLMATYSVMLLTEMLLALTLVIWLALLSRTLRESSSRWALLAGVVLGFAILVKPVAQLLLPLAPAAMLFARGSLRRRCALIAATLMPTVAVTGLWMARNDAVCGVWTISSIGGRYLYSYQGAAAEAWGTGRPLDEVQAEWEQRFQNRPDQSLAGTLAFYRREGLAGIAAHPVAWAVGSTNGAIRIALAPVRAHLQWLCPVSAIALPLMLVQSLIALVAWLGVAAAIVRVRRAPREVAIPIAVMTVALALVILASTGGNANARFRVPAMPFLVIVGLWGLLARPQATDAAADSGS